MNVTDLDISQLGEVRRQLEEVAFTGDLSLWMHRWTYRTDTQELSQLTTSFAQLKQAQAKFKACAENVAEIKPANKSTFL